VPVAQISSDPPAWISQITAQATRSATRGPDTPPPKPPAAPASPQAVTADLLREAIATGGVAAKPTLRGAGPAGSAGPRVRSGTVKWFDESKGYGFISPDEDGKDLFAHHADVQGSGFRTLRKGDRVNFSVAPGPRGPQAVQIQAPGIVSDAERLAQPFGPSHHETGCGFKLRGARAVDMVARTSVGFAGGGPATGDDLRVSPSAPASNVLLVLESGAGVLLPAIPEFLCALSFEDGELVDVAYEPSDNTWRWSEFQQRAHEIRALRGIASSAMARGSFKLEGDDALAIARRMQLAKGVDPSLALYAAYAYHDLQRRDLIRQMADYMGGDLGAPIFDVALLARLLDRRHLARDAVSLIGALPLLAQGWPLLRAFDITLSPMLATLEGHRLPSLWTMFDAAGVDRIRNAFVNGELS
jgi:cold shock CspA family protein